VSEQGLELDAQFESAQDLKLDFGENQSHGKSSS